MHISYELLRKELSSRGMTLYTLHKSRVIKQQTYKNLLSDKDVYISELIFISDYLQIPLYEIIPTSVELDP